MSWIDIEEQHPDFEVPIIVFGEGRVCIARLMRKGITKDTVSLDFQEGDSGLEDLWITPTHWLALPEKPKQNKL